MTRAIEIEIKNEDKIAKNLAIVGGDLPRYLGGARIEVTNLILNTKGVRVYPPATEANQPPTPFYIRGRGMQTSPSHNTHSSQRLGTRWQSVPYKQMGAKIYNPVTYAPFAHGDEQAAHMKRIGWRKLFDAAKEKAGAIAKIYNNWTNQLLRKHGLL